MLSRCCLSCSCLACKHLPVQWRLVGSISWCCLVINQHAEKQKCHLNDCTREKLSKVVTIDSLENMNVCTKAHSNSINSTRWKDRASTKSSRVIILWRPWMSVPTVMVNNPPFFKTFHKKHKNVQLHDGARGRSRWGSLKSVGFILWGR